jgi:hypothetical protein
MPETGLVDIADRFIGPLLTFTLDPFDLEQAGTVFQPVPVPFQQRSKAFQGALLIKLHYIHAALWKLMPKGFHLRHCLC